MCGGGIRSTCGGGVLEARVVVGNLMSTCGGGVLGARVVVGY